MTEAHRPVLLEESVALLCGIVDRTEVREGVYVDATFGRGGHSLRLLELLGPDSRVIGIDRDPEAVEHGQALAASEARLHICHGNFSELGDLLDQVGVAEVQGVLMDLGVSSPQLDDAARGFSFRQDAPLDMRMDTTRGPTAAEWLNQADEAEIARVLKEYGEERYARRIASAIVARRPITRTGELADLVRTAQPRPTPGKHPATRVFQALRMQVNDELGALESGLRVAFERLRVTGRLVVITFHSLEDRLVKRYFRSLTTPPRLPRRLPVRAVDARPAARTLGALSPGEAELAVNPRARSARLRAVEKTP